VATIRFEGKHYPCPEGKTVLDALVEGGAAVAYSCRAGQCRSCMLLALSGTPGPAATEGLKATHAAQGYFLPCVCTPEGDLEVARPGTGAAFIPAEVLSLDRPAEDVARVRLRPNGAFDYRPGQYVSLFRDATRSRPSSTVKRTPRYFSLERIATRVRVWRRAWRST